jgi:23S rRNA (cytidine1920-2'-O)/16S rRNA (cytidine1409-2'-O)-methyltransferase
VVDIGSSTGGFTDCALQHGASSVWCIDVGKNLLDDTLKKDVRVHLLEPTHFNRLDLALIAEKPNWIVMDVSFISVLDLLDHLHTLMRSGAQALVLIKPQFEAEPAEAPGGVIKQEPIRQKVLSRVRSAIEMQGFQVKGVLDSPIKGPKGNLETFFYLGLSQIQDTL